VSLSRVLAEAKIIVDKEIWLKSIAFCGEVEGNIKIRARTTKIITKKSDVKCLLKEVV